MASILDSEGGKVIAIRNNNLLSDAQKIQKIKLLQEQPDAQWTEILSSA